MTIRPNECLVKRNRIVCHYGNRYERLVDCPYAIYQRLGCCFLVLSSLLILFVVLRKLSGHECRDSTDSHQQPPKWPEKPAFPSQV